jgi:hypothetical protein
VAFQHESPGRGKSEKDRMTIGSSSASGPTKLSNNTNHDALLLQYLGQEVYDSLSEFERQVLHDCKMAP